MLLLLQPIFLHRASARLGLGPGRQDGASGCGVKVFKTVPAEREGLGCLVGYNHPRAHHVSTSQLLPTRPTYRLASGLVSGQWTSHQECPARLSPQIKLAAELPSTLSGENPELLSWATVIGGDPSRARGRCADRIGSLASLPCHVLEDATSPPTPRNTAHAQCGQMVDVGEWTGVFVWCGRVLPASRWHHACARR
jgi:hypothetical protein